MEVNDTFTQKLNESRSSLANSAKEAMKWIGDKIKGMAKPPARMFKKASTPTIGEMYLFHYDAKHKATLPMWDAHPLVFPIEFYSDGFLGLNLHYLPPAARAKLLDNLTKLVGNTKYNDNKKLTISYQVLKAHSRQFSGYGDCVKRYLYGHIRSPFHKVDSTDWAKTIMLPLASWQHKR